MRRPREPFDEDDEDDRDDPIASDQDPHGGGSDDFEIVACPFCGKSMSDMADICPHCRNFVSREDFGSGRKPLWAVAVTVLLLVALALGAISFR